MADCEGVIVAWGLSWYWFDESLHPKKPPRMTAEPTNPTSRFELLSDLKLHSLNDAV